MTAPTHQDAEIMLQLARWGAERGNNKAFRFIWSDKFIADFSTFREKYPPGTKQYQYVFRICGYYEAIGALWVNGLLNEKLIYDWEGVTFVWERVKTLALGLREFQGVPEIFENFEALAKKLST